MKNAAVVLCLLAAVAVPAIARAQDEPLDAGLQQNHNYLSLLDFEYVDTMSGNLLLTFSDLVLPGNAGRELRIQRSYNSKRRQWSFGLAGMAMRIIVPNPPPPGTPLGSLAQMRQWTAVIEMADGGRRQTIFLEPPDPAQPSTLNLFTTSQFWRYERTQRTLLIPDGTVCHYDTDGWLIDCSDPFGNIVALAWQPSELRITQQLGNNQSREVVVTLHPATRLPTRMEYSGRIWTYAYADLEASCCHQLQEATVPAGLPWQYAYDAAGVLSFVRTPNGGEVSYTHEVLHEGVLSRAVTQRVTGGRDISAGTWTYEYGFEDSRVSGETVVVTPSGRRMRYFHGTLTTGSVLLDGGSGLTERIVEESSGQQFIELEHETRQYQAVNVLDHGTTHFRTPEVGTRVLTRAGRTYTTQFAYATSDVNGGFHRPTSVTETGELSRTTALSYQHLVSPYVKGLVTQQIVTVGPESFSKLFGYDSSTGFRTSQTLYGITTTFATDTRGNVASVTRPARQPTAFQYSWGRVSQTQTPEHTTTRVISPDGTTQSETQAGRTSSFEYDPLGRVTEAQPPGGSNATLTEYDPNGAWVRTTRGTTPATTSISTTTLDGFGRPIRVVNAVGVESRMTYDAEGRKNYEGYPFIAGIGSGDIGATITYDALDRIRRRTNPDSTFAEWTYGPGTITIRDENARNTVHVYSAFGDPDDARLVGVTDADQKLWTYGYNGLGQLTQVTALDGAIRTWTYVPGTNRLQSEQHPESGLTSYVYDTAGVLAQKTDARGTVFTFTRDANDRMTAETAGGRVSTTSYEPGSDNRRLTRAGSASAEFFYDAVGRVSARHDNVDGRIFRTRYEYDTNDNLTAIRYPTLHATNTRRLVQFEYDAERRLTRVFEGGTSYGSNLQYHPSGALTRYTAGNGLETVLTFDPSRYWPTSIAVGALSLQYQNYDGVGNVGTIADARSGMGQTFGYDALDRLTSASGFYGSVTYAYDAHGNRQTSGGTTYSYQSGTLRLGSQGSSTFGYDNNGNLTSAPNATYTYTPRNMLESAAVVGGTSTYAYDPDDWRVKKTSSGSTTYSIRGLDTQVLTDWTNPGPTGQVRDYVYAGSQLIAAVARSTSEDANDLYGTIVPNGPAVSMTFTTAGQRSWLEFQGVEGQTVSLTGTESNVTGTGIKSLWAPISIVRASDGYAVNGCACSNSTVFLDRGVLPSTGTYYVMTDPYGSTIGTETVNLYDVVDYTGSVVVDGPAVSFTLGTPGQRGFLTFNGTSGQRISVIGLASNTSAHGSASSLWYPIEVRKPDGTVLAAYNDGGGHVAFDTPVLPVDGIYTLVIDPFLATIGTATVRVYSVNDISGTMTIGGPSVTAALTVPGQRARYTFSGAASQRVSLKGTKLAAAAEFGSAWLWWPLAILKPDGSTLEDLNDSGNVLIEPVVLPSAGTYTVLIDPYEATTGTGEVQLYEVTDVTGSVGVNGGALAVSLPAPGQKACVTFAGTAGQLITVRLTGNTIGTTAVKLLKPDSTQLTSRTSSSANFNLTQQTLPVSGTYTIVIDPLDSRTGNISVAATNP